MKYHQTSEEGEQTYTIRKCKIEMEFFVVTLSEEMCEPARITHQKFDTHGGFQYGHTSTTREFFFEKCHPFWPYFFDSFW